MTRILIAMFLLIIMISMFIYGRLPAQKIDDDSGQLIEFDKSNFEIVKIETVDKIKSSDKTFKAGKRGHKQIVVELKGKAQSGGHFIFTQNIFCLSYYIDGKPYLVSSKGIGLNARKQDGESKVYWTMGEKPGTTTRLIFEEGADINLLVAFDVHKKAKDFSILIPSHLSTTAEQNIGRDGE